MNSNPDAEKFEEIDPITEIFNRDRASLLKEMRKYFIDIPDWQVGLILKHAKQKNKSKAVQAIEKVFPELCKWDYC